MTQNNMEVVAWRWKFEDQSDRSFLAVKKLPKWYDERQTDIVMEPLVTLTAAQAEIELLEADHEANMENMLAIIEVHKARAEAAEKERDALREALDSSRNLPITDAELVRMNNSAVGTDEVRISSRMLLLLVGLAMSTRSALQPLEPTND